MTIRYASFPSTRDIIIAFISRLALWSILPLSNALYHFLFKSNGYGTLSKVFLFFVILIVFAFSVYGVTRSIYKLVHLLCKPGSLRMLFLLLMLFLPFPFEFLFFKKSWRHKSTFNIPAFMQPAREQRFGCLSSMLIFLEGGIAEINVREIAKLLREDYYTSVDEDENSYIFWIATNFGELHILLETTKAGIFMFLPVDAQNKHKITALSADSFWELEHAADSEDAALVSEFEYHPIYASNESIAHTIKNRLIDLEEAICNAKR